MKLVKFMLVAFLLMSPVYTGDKAYGDSAAPLGDEQPQNIYYVDFENGADTNEGMAEANAWKHAPGDPDAESVPAAKILQSGDVVRFKGGVTYRGSIRLNGSGSETGDITYSGSGWGDKPAVFSGADQLDVVWERCTSPDQVNGNPNYAKIYYAILPAEQNFFETLYQGDSPFYFSQYPKQPDPFSFNDTNHFITRNLPDERYAATLNSVRDNDFFTQPSGYWDNAYITLWVYPNVCVTRKVTGYDPASHTISFEDITGNTLYTDVLKYSMLNNAALIDSVGKYSYDTASNTIYIWPYDPAFTEPVNVAKRDRAFNINGKSNITIEGFNIKEFIGLPGGYHQGVAVFNLDREAKNVTVKNNKIYNIRSMGGSGVIDFNYGDNVKILNNEIRNVQRASGITVMLQNSIISGNTIDKTGRSGIRTLGSASYPGLNLQIVDNRIKNIFDIHGNGITVYDNNINCLVARNIVTEASRPMTMHGYHTPDTNHNIIIYNNLFIAQGDDAVAALTDWGSQLNNVKILNNILISPYSVALTLHYDADNVTVKNNIIKAFAVTKIGTKNRAADCRSLPGKGWVFSNNIYTALSWMQTKAVYNWKLGSGESGSTEKALFKAPSKKDYSPAAKSPAINAGVDVTPLIGKYFPGFDPMLDLNLAKRIVGKCDIGCYEMQPIR
ncbi:MAG TPA: right-handed parallel beta-helix repeat-containing protein [Clostridia bacterium]|nr:right-handed parallel beta-helix repeat-containing protein [Clostridia bacterium]